MRPMTARRSRSVNTTHCDRWNCLAPSRASSRLRSRCHVATSFNCSRDICRIATRTSRMKLSVAGILPGLHRVLERHGHAPSRLRVDGGMLENLDGLALHPAGLRFALRFGELHVSNLME